jgi:tetratricopeptide (TPR) repeat protein
VFAHSWSLLSAEERDVFRRLSVFQGGFRREAAERVAGASLPLLLALVDKSLLDWRPEGRYEMHELLKQYAAEKLEEIPAEREIAQDRHASYYMEFLHQQEERLKSSQQKQASAEIRLEIGNVRSAWQWAVSHGWGKKIGQSVSSLWIVFDVQGWFHEAEALFREAVVGLQRKLASGEEDSGLSLPLGGLRLSKEEQGEAERELGIALGQVMAQQAWFSLRVGLYEEARGLTQKSLALLRRFNAPIELANAVYPYAMLSLYAGSYEEAQALLEEGLAIHREYQNRWEVGLYVYSLGVLFQTLGKYTEAKQLSQQALAIFEEMNDSRMCALVLNILGATLSALGEPLKAKQLLRKSLAISREVESRWSVAVCLNQLGMATYLSDSEAKLEAKQLHQESLAISKELGDSWSTSLSLNYLGYVTCALEEYQEAKQHFLAALQLAVEIQLIFVALDALVGLATLLVRQPEGGIKPALSGSKEQAVELLAFVLGHPATIQDTKDKAQHLLAEMEAELPPSVIAAAQKRGQVRELEEMAAEILAKIE